MVLYKTAKIPYSSVCEIFEIVATYLTGLAFNRTEIMHYLKHTTKECEATVTEEDATCSVKQ
jgi:hypothetical protein